MPLVKRAEHDMLRFSGLCDLLVNPVCSDGSSNSGLAKAFFDRWPDLQSEYLKRCSENLLNVNEHFIFTDTTSKTKIYTVATKRNWRDTTDRRDLEICCYNLSQYLQRTSPFITVAMPVLGIGYSRQEKFTIDPILLEHLDYLPNIIHLCARPDRFEKPPLYLAVIGSRAYTDYDRICFGVYDGLIKFEKKFEDFEAMVSGGAPGVDRIACGTGSSDDKNPNIAKSNGMKAIVCQADWDRFQKSAGFIRNRTVADIGTHFIAFVGSDSIGTRGLVELVLRHNEYADKMQKAFVLPTGGDVFNHPIIPPPEKKELYICDISSVSI